MKPLGFKSVSVGLVVPTTGDMPGTGRLASTWRRYDLNLFSVYRVSKRPDEIPAFLLYRSYFTVSVFWHEAVVREFRNRHKSLHGISLNHAAPAHNIAVSMNGSPDTDSKVIG
jgi:hypothetical protein